MSKPDISGIILAGGESRRFGQDKAFLSLGSKTLVEVIWEKLKSIPPWRDGAELIISANNQEKYKIFKNARIVQDVFAERSSLNGIYSALQAAKNSYGFVIACDMPLINPEFIKYVISRRKNYDVVIPESPKGLEPLCAVYSRNCLSFMERQLKNKNFKIIDFFSEVKVNVINLKKLIPLGVIKNPEEAGILNINTLEDYQEIINTNKSK